MKLNKVEKIIVAVIILGLILVGGGFMFVMPSFQNISAAQKKLEANQKEQDALIDELSRLNTIDADIDTAKKDAVKYEGSFYPDLTTYEASEMAMALLKSFNLEAHSITVTALSTKDLMLEGYIPNEVTYELKTNSQAAKSAGESAEESVEGTFKDGGKTYRLIVTSPTDTAIFDENDNEIEPSKYTETMKKYLFAGICKYSQLSTIKQIVGVTEVTYEVEGKYSDYMKFIDYIYSMDRATAFRGISLPCTVTIKEDKDSTNMYVGENGTIAMGDEANGKETLCKDDTHLEEMNVVLQFFSVEPMGEVKTLDANGTTITVDQRPTVY